MGIRVGMSSCSMGETVGIAVKDPRNPDPKKFNILHHVKEGKYVLLLVEYPGCTTFEGKKLLVFRDLGLRKLLALTELDPHFCDDPSHPSPVARFRPDDQGWADAVAFARSSR